MPVDLQPDEIENRVRQERPVPAPRFSLIAKKPAPSYEQAIRETFPPSYDKALKNIEKIHRKRSHSAPGLSTVPKNYEKVIVEKQEKRLETIKRDMEPLEIIKRKNPSKQKTNKDLI